MWLLLPLLVGAISPPGEHLLCILAWAPGSLVHFVDDSWRQIGIVVQRGDLWRVHGPEKPCPCVQAAPLESRALDNGMPAQRAEGRLHCGLAPANGHTSQDPFVPDDFCFASSLPSRASLMAAKSVQRTLIPTRRGRHSTPRLPALAAAAPKAACKVVPSGNQIARVFGGAPSWFKGQVLTPSLPVAASKASSIALGRRTFHS